MLISSELHCQPIFLYITHTMGFSPSDEDSWSDGEQEPLTVDQTWRGDPDSEADSIDSDQEDPLK